MRRQAFVFKIDRVHSFLERFVKIPAEKLFFIEVHISPKIKYSVQTNFATNLIQQLSIPAI